MTIVTITTDAKNLKKNQDYNDQSIQELEQRLNELVLQDPPHQTNSILELSTAAIKKTFYNTHATCKKHFKPKVFSRKAVELLAVGATIAGATYASQQSSKVTSVVATNNLLYGSMNVLMYNLGVSYPQMLMINLFAYPLESQSFFGGFGQVVGGMLGTFFGGRRGGFNVGISSQPVIIKIDPASFNEVITEASKQVRFVVDKIEQAQENLVILSFEQGRITLKEAGDIVQIIVDDVIASAFKGALLTIENFGNMLKARIDHGAQEAKLIINYIPFIARTTSFSIIDGFKHSLLQSFWYSYSRHLKNEIQNYILKTQDLQTQDPNLIKLLIDFVWIQRIRPELSAQDKESLYKELLIIVNNPSNSIEKLRELFLLIGYTAVHDPSMQVLSRSFWQFSITNHTKNIIAAIPDAVVWNMLENLDYKAIHQIFPAIKIIRETLLLPDVVAGETNINEYINKLKEQLELSEQQQKIIFSTITITIASIALLFYNRNSQYLQTIKSRFPWLFTHEAVEIVALGITVLVITNVIQQQNSINKEILRCINKLSNGNNALGEQIKRYEPIIFENVDKLKTDIEYVAHEIENVAEEQQINKQAISFLYDKMKEAHTVAFKTQNFGTHGIEIPVPDGFEKQDCSFLVAGRCHSQGEYASEYNTGGFTAFPWGGYDNCHNKNGAYVVLASKPVIPEQEVEEKKKKYKLHI